MRITIDNPTQDSTVHQGLLTVGGHAAPNSHIHLDLKMYGKDKGSRDAKADGDGMWQTTAPFEVMPGHYVVHALDTANPQNVAHVGFTASAEE